MVDFLVIGAGSSGCVLAAELLRRKVGTVRVLEAGPSERHPLVSIPFGLVWLLGSRRDWGYRSAPMAGVGGRQIAIPRGRMVGGSGSINSMVWFRGRAADFDNWQVPGWSFADVLPAFEAVEAQIKPSRLVGAHPMTEALAAMVSANTDSPTPDVESAGVFQFNVSHGRRRSAADAFARPGGVEIRCNIQVDRVLWQGDRAVGVVLADGTEIRAEKGVVLCAGAIASPAILMRSGVGPASLRRLGIDLRCDLDGVGRNLHDHPAIGLHFEGAGTGYGLEIAQWPFWALAPFAYGLARKGRFASPTVEGGAFFNARGDVAEPDVQTHFIPFHLDHRGRKYALKSGYFADVCVCRPKSRGHLRLVSRDPKAAPEIDLGLFEQASDLNTLVHGVARLRRLLADAFGKRAGVEMCPGQHVQEKALHDHVRTRSGTAYHPVGSVALGGPLTERLAVKGVRQLWVADASVMPAITSANTNAPAMMIGWRGAEIIAEDVA